MFLVQIFAGLFCLFLGGESLVRGAVKVAEKMNLSKIIVAVTIVAYGTSSPELMITLNSALKDYHDIAIGNVIGSNIANTFLVLGLAAIICPINVAKSLVKFDMKYMILASFAMLVFILSGYLGRVEASLLVAILLIYTIFTIRTHNKKGDIVAAQVQELEEQLDVKLGFKTAVAACVSGVVLLIYGSNILVDGATTLARIYQVSDAAIAVTIVAIGGSAPEIATSTVAAFRKHSDIAIGNVIGSNLFNILGVLGIGGLVKPLYTNSVLVSFDIWVMVLSSLLIYFIVHKKYQVSRFNGFILLACYLLYISWHLFT